MHKCLQVLSYFHIYFCIWKIFYGAYTNLLLVLKKLDYRNSNIQHIIEILTSKYIARVEKAGV